MVVSVEGKGLRGEVGVFIPSLGVGPVGCCGLDALIS